MEYTVWHYACLATTLFGSSLLQAVVGFGAGVFGIPILMLCGFDAHVAIIAVSVGSMCQAMMGSMSLKGDIEWHRAFRPAIFRLIWMPLGGYCLWLVGNMGQQQVRQAIGIVLLLIVFVRVRVKVIPTEELHIKWEYIAFSISGVLLGFCGMGGPAVALWVMAQPWNPRKSRAFLFAIMFLGMIPLFIQFYVMYPDDALYAMLLGLATFPTVLIGGVVGMKVGNKLERERLQKYTLVLLTVIGISALLSPYLRPASEGAAKPSVEDAAEHQVIPGLPNKC